MKISLIIKLFFGFFKSVEKGGYLFFDQMWKTQQQRAFISFFPYLFSDGEQGRFGCIVDVDCIAVNDEIVIAPDIQTEVFHKPLPRFFG